MRSRTTCRWARSRTCTVRSSASIENRSSSRRSSTMTDAIRIVKAAAHKPKPKDADLTFGTVFTDHMFVADFQEEKGWYDPRVEPYGPIPLDPAAAVLHYAQAVFDGLKAFRGVDDKVRLFRPQKHVERMNRSAERMCIPPLDPELALRSLVTLVGAYYPEGMAPVKIRVEEHYVRAVEGGLGGAKTGANYAASLMAGEEAKHEGFTQVLWLDGVHRKYIDEVGTMNIMVKIAGEVITPPLGGTILPGVTRDSVLTLLKDWGAQVSERQISIDEVLAAHEAGTLEEVFGTGTAAMISPVGELAYKARRMVINGGAIGPLTQKLYDAIVGIQYAKVPDPHAWTVEV